MSEPAERRTWIVLLAHALSWLARRPVLVGVVAIVPTAVATAVALGGATLRPDDDTAALAEQWEAALVASAFLAAFGAILVGALCELSIARAALRAAPVGTVAAVLAYFMFALLLQEVSPEPVSIGDAFSGLLFPIFGIGATAAAGVLGASARVVATASRGTTTARGRGGAEKTWVARKRPLWAVFLLTAGTLSMYFFVHLGLMWAEMKRARQDPSMKPVGHAFAQLVPFYGWFRFHAHVRTLDEMLRSAGSPHRVSAESATAVCVVLVVLAGVAGSGIPPTWLIFSLFAAFAAWRQQALNAYYDQISQRSIPERVHGFEWVVMVAGMLFVTLAAIGTFLT